MAPQIRASDGHVLLTRASSLAGTPGVVLTDRDLPALERLTGSRSRSHELLSRLVEAGRMRQVRRGAYVLVDDAGTIQADALDLINALTPRPYLVTGGRALQFHELTDQHFRRVDVLVRAHLRPWSWRGSTIYYSKTTSSFVNSVTRTRRTVAAMARPERAIADSLERPGWGVTVPQVAEALDLLLRRDQESADHLAVLVADIYGHALARRMGFLISTLAGYDQARAFLPLLGKSKGATLLLAGGPATGPVDARWNVLVNVSPETLTQHRAAH